ncbi:MAG: hypothetical protein ABJG47_09075 [Ekhidna sp.]
MINLRLTTNQLNEMKEKDSEEQISENSSGANDNRLEAVRDLLFGPNDQAYRQEFKEIKDQVAKNKSDFEEKSDALKEDIIDRLEKLENKITENVNSAQADLSKQIEGLNAGKVDRKQLAQMLQTLAKELES